MSSIQSSEFVRLLYAKEKSFVPSRSKITIANLIERLAVRKARKQIKTHLLNSDIETLYRTLQSHLHLHTDVKG